MKKFFAIMSFAVVIIAAIAGCSFASQGGTVSSSASEDKNNMGAETKQTISDEKQRIKLTFINLTAGNTVIEAELEDNETSKDFIASLPITLPMKRYDDREYYGHIAKLSENGPSIPDFSNGDVTYHPSGPSFAVFFGREEDSYQPGLIRMGRVTSDLVLFGKLGESPEVRIEVKK